MGHFRFLTEKEAHPLNLSLLFFSPDDPHPGRESGVTPE